eukprot:scaffold1440_cov92-Skeletonema_dohrnii-CCMP3373.AAC.1
MDMPAMLLHSLMAWLIDFDVIVRLHARAVWFLTLDKDLNVAQVQSSALRSLGFWRQTRFSGRIIS